MDVRANQVTYSIQYKVLNQQSTIKLFRISTYTSNRYQQFTSVKCKKKKTYLFKKGSEALKSELNDIGNTDDDVANAYVLMNPASTNSIISFVSSAS